MMLRFRRQPRRSPSPGRRFSVASTSMHLPPVSVGTAGMVAARLRATSGNAAAATPSAWWNRLDRRFRQRNAQRLARLAFQQAKRDQVGDVVARGLEVLAGQVEQARGHLVRQNALLAAGEGRNAIVQFHRHVQQGPVRHRVQVADRLHPACPRQVDRIEDAVQRLAPRLAAAGQRLQDDAALLRIQPARRHKPDRRIERRGRGREFLRQCQQMAIEQVEQRRQSERRRSGPTARRPADRSRRVSVPGFPGCVP